MLLLLPCGCRLLSTCCCFVKPKTHHPCPAVPAAARKAAVAHDVARLICLHEKRPETDLRMDTGLMVGAAAGWHCGCGVLAATWVLHTRCAAAAARIHVGLAVPHSLLLLLCSTQLRATCVTLSSSSCSPPRRHLRTFVSCSGAARWWTPSSPHRSAKRAATPAVIAPRQPHACSSTCRHSAAAAALLRRVRQGMRQASLLRPHTRRRPSSSRHPSRHSSSRTSRQQTRSRRCRRPRRSKGPAAERQRGSPHPPAAHPCKTQWGQPRMRLAGPRLPRRRRCAGWSGPHRGAASMSPR